MVLLRGRAAGLTALWVVLALVGCDPSAADSSSSAAPADSRGGGGSRSAAQPPPRPSSSIALPAPSGATEISPLPTASGDAGQPMPELATVKKLALRKEQGGPAIKRCNGVAYEVEVDLVASSFAYRICDPNTKGPAGNEPLTRQSGKLTDTSRKQIEQAYAALLQEPASGCGHDGGPLTLTLTFKSGKTERWVDQNWGCVQPPPQVAHGLQPLRMALMNVGAPAQ